MDSLYSRHKHELGPDGSSVDNPLTPRGRLMCSYFTTRALTESKRLEAQANERLDKLAEVLDAMAGHMRPTKVYSQVIDTPEPERWEA